MGGEMSTYADIFLLLLLLLKPLLGISFVFCFLFFFLGGLITLLAI